MRHYQKVKGKKFYDIFYKTKNFILVEDNQKYNVGDIVVLDEFNDLNKATGKAIARTITYIQRNEDGLKDGYCILGLKF